jgi:glutamate formiminotransferase / 5-formyltetrahydrofolate cyclo-ligase
VDLFESVPNFSEGRDQGVIEAIVEASAPAHLLDADPDPDHHRVVVSLAAFGDRLVDGLVGAVGVAAERIDLRQHQGAHPRVGASDVVPIVPFGDTSLAACRELAHELGERIWADVHLPVYFYGDGERSTLADIRTGRAQPDLGGPDLHPTAGAVCVGARRPLVAFNVILFEGIAAPEARVLARSLRESGGGMRGVQALVFELPGGRVQLSMNLFRLEETSPEAVIGELSRREVGIGSQHVVGLCPAEVANATAAGRLLEGRLAAAAARAGAERCSKRGGDEHAALARRLRREADGLAALGIDQEEILGGAERAAALVPVLRAARVIDDELRAMLGAATAGLRKAIGPKTREAFAARLAALDTRLASPAGE